jgi:hypothetical protein
MPVPIGRTSIDIRFPTPNPTAVFIEQSWLTNRAISNKTAEGFTVTFAEAVSKDATLWCREGRLC